VALATFERCAQPHSTGHVHAVNNLVRAILLLIRSSLDIDGRTTMEPRRNLLVECRAFVECWRQQIARDLLDRKSVERHVGIKRANHPVAKRPDRAMAVALIAVAV